MSALPTQHGHFDENGEVTGNAADPLLLGHRVVEILETATYKLATLMALVDHCIEHLPENPDDTLQIPIRELAERVMDLYWYQVLCFDKHLQLRQSTGGATIVAAVLDFRAAPGVGQ